MDIWPARASHTTWTNGYRWCVFTWCELPAFVGKIKEIFERWQLAQYLETARETEPFDPDLFVPRSYPFLGEETIEVDAEEIEDMRKDDIRQCTRDLLLVERAREWLLEGDGGEVVTEA
jgi:hypothetical protein